jgi:hypothetical protein
MSCDKLSLSAGVTSRSVFRNNPHGRWGGLVIMYEARHGAFDYTIERRLAGDGQHSWHWQVRRAGELLFAGVSPRSHVHAETVALSFIFQSEADERCRREAPASHPECFG